ncbi:hypothetical protein K443DRAFT_13133 [Laccaria amethystina LaAM-08-1]|uniref:Uncharacterized protein n=1 Tax=Laccaria amethystina LaAM-08-1 TaxID=1095629 RepID=A0A0C9X623_9AGAR|nr:hypothetical protein K443DRAFT_13133 [Laccaria amethystina LaAM-08-1]
MAETINRGTTSTRKGSSAGQIERAKAVSMPSKQPVNDEEIRIIVTRRSGAGKSSVRKSYTKPIEAHRITYRVRMMRTIFRALVNALIPVLRLPYPPSSYRRARETRWSEIKQAVAEGRETELKTQQAFFKPVTDAGAMHAYSRPVIPLLIREEMVDGGKRPSETEAGQALRTELAEQELDAEVKEMREKVSRLKEEMKKISSAQLPSATSNGYSTQLRLQSSTNKQAPTSPSSNAHTPYGQMITDRSFCNRPPFFFFIPVLVRPILLIVVVVVLGNETKPQIRPQTQQRQS